MKGQALSSVSPSAQIAVPGSSAINSEGAEALKEQQERIYATEKADRKINKERGKVANFLNAKCVVTDVTFPFLSYGRKQLSVSEYYPEIKIAVDKFFSMNDFDEKEIQFKREAFKKSDIAYGYLLPDSDLVDLAVQLGIE